MRLLLNHKDFLIVALNRQRNDIAQMGNIGAIANNMKVMPTPNTQGNMLGVSEASTAWRDLQALEAAKKKGQNAWGSILVKVMLGVLF